MLWMLAQAALRGGMEALNQAEISSALQVYFNLRELPQARPLPVCAHAGYWP